MTNEATPRPLNKIELEIESVKGLREDLCVVQSALSMYPSGDQKSRIKRIGKLIEQLDIMRPLASNGKHGKLHTDKCGCDVPDPTPEQEIDIIDRIISGLPVDNVPFIVEEYMDANGERLQEMFGAVPEVKLYDVNSLYPQEFRLTEDRRADALIAAANKWRKIPEFENYEVNPLGVIRSKWTKRVLEVTEDGDQKFVAMHDKDGFDHAVNVNFVMEKVYGK